MAEYDRAFSLFIPKWWVVPHQISMQFCKITADQFDDQLSKYPEPSQNIVEAKKLCKEFEEELQRNMRPVLRQHLDEDEVTREVRIYDGLMSGTLDMHLHSYVDREKEKARTYLDAVRQEKFSRMQDSGELEELRQSKNARIQHLSSTDGVLQAMRMGFAECLGISRGQPLVELLKNYFQLMGEYARLMSGNVHDCVNVITPKHARTSSLSHLDMGLSRHISRLKSGLLWEKSHVDDLPDATVEELITYLATNLTSAQFCRDSIPNLEEAGVKALTLPEHRAVIDARPTHALLQNVVQQTSESLSQIIATYCGRKLSEFRNYDWCVDIGTNKTRTVEYNARFESELAIMCQILYPRVEQIDYFIIIKRSIIFLGEMLFEAVLLSRRLDENAGRLLLDFLERFEQALMNKTANAMDQAGPAASSLSIHIQRIVNKCFHPTRLVLELCATSSRGVSSDRHNSSLLGRFQQAFSRGSTPTSSTVTPSDVPEAAEPPSFESKAVEFYQSSHLIVDFKELVKEVSNDKSEMESKSSEHQSLFLDTVREGDDVAPASPQSIGEKKWSIIQRVMEIKGYDSEAQKRIRTRCFRPVPTKRPPPPPGGGGGLTPQGSPRPSPRGSPRPSPRGSPRMSPAVSPAFGGQTAPQTSPPPRSNIPNLLLSHSGSGMRWGR